MMIKVMLVEPQNVHKHIIVINQCYTTRLLTWKNNNLTFLFTRAFVRQIKWVKITCVLHKKNKRKIDDNFREIYVCDFSTVQQDGQINAFDTFPRKTFHFLIIHTVNEWMTSFDCKNILRDVKNFFGAIEYTKQRHHLALFYQ